MLIINFTDLAKTPPFSNSTNDFIFNLPVTWANMKNSYTRNQNSYPNQKLNRTDYIPISALSSQENCVLLELVLSPIPSSLDIIFFLGNENQPLEAV